MDNDSNQFRINIPESYGQQKNEQHLTPVQIVNKVPLATNKVRKLVIRGTLKNDTSPE